MSKTLKQRRVLISLVILAILNQLVPTWATQNPVPGKKCFKIDQTVTFLDRNYTCISRNKKLIWNKGYEVSWYQRKSDIKLLKPITQNENLQPTEICKLKTITSRLGGISSGFPNKSALHNLWDINALALYVDFPDKVGKVLNYSTDVKELQKISNYYTSQSYGKLIIKWSSSNRYARMPKNIQEYNLNHSTFQTSKDDNSVFLQDAITAADGFINFSDYDLVIIMPPDTATFDDFGSYAGTRSGELFKIYSAEGQVKNIQTYLPRRTNYGTSMLAGSWGGTLHEIGHELGLVDYYNYKNPGDGRNRGNSGTDDRVIYNYDPMSDLWSGTGSELLAWSKFLLGFLQESSVRCIYGPQETFHLISPIELSEGVNAVFYKIDDNRLIAMEFRYPTGYDLNLNFDQIGLIAYLIDTSRDSGQGPLKILLPEKFTDVNNPALRPGKSINFENIKIDVIDGNSKYIYFSISTI